MQNPSSSHRVSKTRPDKPRAKVTLTPSLKAAPKLVLLLLALACISCTPAVTSTDEFSAKDFHLADFGLFDLGVAEINSDNLLDVFTSNHSGPQSLLINQGGGIFRDRFTTAGLDQDKSFPGLVVTPKQPAFPQPGLYVYWLGPELHVRGYEQMGDQQVSVHINLMSPVKIIQQTNVKVVQDEKKLPAGTTLTSIKFSMPRNGNLAFKPFLHAVPIEFKLTGNIIADHIFVGPENVSPDSTGFTLRMRDRHGMAWNSFRSENQKDVFITRGAQKGWMKRMPESYYDELLVHSPKGFTDIGTTAGLLKNGCSGRQASWVDYDNDGLLDIYVACGRKQEYQPNQLFHQLPDGTFRDEAKNAGLDIGLKGAFTWLDADADNDLDLFWVDSQGFYLYENDSGRFTAHHLGISPAGRSHKLTAADFDADGDIDIFVASTRQNTLCVNTGGSFVITNAKSWGLPQRSVTANWVDFDNDSLIDLHVLPDGLYRQTTQGKFSPMGNLDLKSSRLVTLNLRDSRAIWFDADNNGSRDLLLALNFTRKTNRLTKLLTRLGILSETFSGLKSFWDVSFYQNNSKSNHWLQVKLVGPPGNRPAIGATVSVATSVRTQIQFPGAAGGSHYSQGHYRLYFGLGAHENPERVVVHWPDGSKRVINQPRGDQILEIRWDKTSENKTG